jgi:hypothetical protein
MEKAFSQSFSQAISQNGRHPSEGWDPARITVTDWLFSLILVYI